MGAKPSPPASSDGNDPAYDQERARLYAPGVPMSALSPNETRLPVPATTGAGYASRLEPPELEPLGRLPYPLEARTHAPHVTIVIPAFDEQPVLQLTYARVRDAMEALGVSWSVLFVNDGSRDATVEVLESLYRADERVSYILLSRNFGHQAALTAGLDHAHGDVIVTMDADLQHPPELIATMLDAWHQGYDVVHTRKLATEDLGKVRGVVTRLAYRAIRRVATVPFVSQASDFRLLDGEARDAVNRLPERGRLYRGLTPWVGFRQAVMPYVAPARANGVSSYGVRQLAALFARSFFDFSSAPLYVALVLGSTAIFACGGYVAFVLAAYLLGSSIPSGYVSLIFVVVFLSSINLTLLGVLGVYVSRIYDEVRGRPTYVIGRMRSRALEPRRPGRVDA